METTKELFGYKNDADSQPTYKGWKLYTLSYKHHRARKFTAYL